MNVLISAYACEPNRGSEPEVGWRWVCEMAKYCKVTVLTRSNNKLVIEQYANENSVDLSHIRFLYFDLGVASRKFKKRLSAHELYYILWQRKARRIIEAQLLKETYDLVHLVTFASFRYPVFLGNLGVPVIWGPVGGGELAPIKLLLYNAKFKAILKESLRNIATLLTKNFVKFIDPTVKSGGVAIASTRATQQILRRKGILCDLMPTIGVDIIEDSAFLKMPTTKNLKLLFVGRLVTLKGLVFVIDALSQISSQKKVTLTIVGDGPQKNYLISYVEKLGLMNTVYFEGYVPKGSLGAYYKSHHVVVAPSLYESGNFSVLEGFQFKRPAIVSNVGGLALSVDENCGYKIAQDSVKSVIDGLVTSIQSYIQHPELLTKHGELGYAKLKNRYEWKEKGKKMYEIYKGVINKNYNKQKI